MINLNYLEFELSEKFSRSIHLRLIYLFGAWREDSMVKSTDVLTEDPGPVPSTCML